MNNNKNEVLLNGIWKENPVLVSLLGLCSVLAISLTIENALGMGIAFSFVLIMSNVIISLIRNIVPSEIRIPVYIVVVATLVVIVEMLMAAFLPALYESLGIFIPLIVVNCIILGRAEAFASKNDVFDSFLDAIGMSLGYTIVLIVLSMVREFFASGNITIWGNLQLSLPEKVKEIFC
ncbi:MAG: electron transport complex subunit RsxE [Bacilli bacterium]